MRTKQILGLTVLVLGVWACGSDGAALVADAMVDAASALRDGASGDAAAQVSFEGECAEVTSTATGTDLASGRVITSETTGFVADVAVPGLDPSHVSRAFAVVCGLEEFAPVYTCPASTSTTSYACTGTYFYSAQADCQTIDVQLEPGHARAICGIRQRTMTSTGTTTTGLTRHHARFVIEL